MKTFKDLKEGEHAYTIVRMRGRAPYAVMQRLSGPAGGKYIRTLPCYSDGMAMIYFGSLWHARSGWEVRLPRHGHRPRQRLVLDLPPGIEVARNPRPFDVRAAWLDFYRDRRRWGKSGRDLWLQALSATMAKDASDGARGLAAARMFSLLDRAPSLPMRAQLQRDILNGFGVHNPLQAPSPSSPRFESWRRFACRADALRTKLLARGMIATEAGGYVGLLLTPFDGKGASL